jgi:hypothetical protein
MRWLLALIAVAWPAWACSCTEPAPACERFHQARVVFTGTVLDHNDDNSGRYTQVTSYLVRVDEAFRGLAVDQKEIFIDPGSLTSCYTHYETGKQYLFYAWGEGNAVTASYSGPAVTVKPFPERWAAKKDFKTYNTGMCSGSKPRAVAEDDVNWMRASLKGETLTRVYGSVYQNYRTFLTTGANAPLPGARIVLQSGSKELVRAANSDGDFSFEGVEPGSYELFAEQAPYHQRIQVAAGGCAQRVLSVQSNGQITGSVVDHTGKAASNVRVELVRVLPGGNTAPVYSVWADTDGDGHFHMTETPGGTFVVGVNIGSIPHAEEPWPATYYPGVPSFQEAKIFELKAHENAGSIALKLPPPLPLRSIRVHVYWADGTEVVSGARAFAEPVHPRYQYNIAEPSNIGVTSGNVVTFRVLQEYAYKVRADWFAMTRTGMFHVLSDPIVVPAGREASAVHIRLQGNKP